MKKGKDEIIVGILKGFHEKEAEKYRKACEDLQFWCEIIDFLSPNWIANIEKSKADIFMVRPDVSNSVKKQMYDERLFFLTKSMKKKIYPSYDELFIYENKRNMAYWLEINKVPHPKTKVFYLTKNIDPVLDNLKKVSYPIVYKTYIGSAAQGVKILQSYKQAKNLVNQIIKKGFKIKHGDKHDIHWGYAIFQDFIPNAKEWRIIKIGNSFFGHQKLKSGEFHSGSHKVEWIAPSKKLLRFCKDICDKGNFTSMDIDLFEDESGRYFVNELQSIFGSYDPSQMYINGKPGRFLYDRELDDWIFEEGYFCQNYSHNLRIEFAVSELLR